MYRIIILKNSDDNNVMNTDEMINLGKFKGYYKCTNCHSVV